MANLVAGKITAHGPVKTDGHMGTDVAFLEYPGIEPPPGLVTPGLIILHILPLDGKVDMDTLHANWVLFDKKVLNQEIYCELPRFTPDGDVPPEQPTGKKYKVELTVTGTITEV